MTTIYQKTLCNLFLVNVIIVLIIIYSGIYSKTQQNIEGVRILRHHQTIAQVEKNLIRLAKDVDITQNMMEKSITHFGDVSKFHRLCKEIFLKQRKISIAILGGSASASFHTTSKTKRYFDHVAIFLEEIFNVEIEIVNESLGGTQSIMSSYCLQNMLNVTNVDIILLEFAINDNFAHVNLRGRTIEDLVRHLKSFPCKEQPYVIFANLISTQILFSNLTKFENCTTVEDEYFNAVAKYYNIAAVSWKNQICEKTHKSMIGFKFDDISKPDKNHPTLKGHAQLGYMISFLLLRLYKMFQQNPSGKSLNTKIPNNLTTMLTKPIDPRVWLANPACFMIKHDIEQMCNNKNNNVYICLKERKSFRFEQIRNIPGIYSNTPKGYLKFQCVVNKETFKNRKKIKIGFAYRAPLLETTYLKLNVFSKNTSYLSENILFPLCVFYVTRTYESNEILTLTGREFTVEFKPVATEKDNFKLYLVALLIGFVDDSFMVIPNNSTTGGKTVREHHHQ
ncbi:unnamed protein product [Owenia fusiformis]|uniref:Uncharacterized protein n=1 Tax=Owenia fusiformis TaxID=6347 RepID=A0A8J1U5W7_OWEFU|nr:unnamed protein product [Owenia fusiformis]